MKKEINEAAVQKHNHYGNIFSLLFIVSLIIFVPLVKFLGVFGIIVRVCILIGVVRIWYNIFIVDFMDKKGESYGTKDVFT